MLYQVKNFFLSAMAFALLSSAVLVLGNNTVQAQELPPLNKVALIATLKVNNMSRKDLFNFVTNVDNDVYYYPGVETSETIVPGPNGELEGSVHLQTGTFNGFPFQTTITIKKVVNPLLMIHEGTGLLSYKTIYTFTPGLNGSAVFTNSSIIEGYGITPEQISEFTTYSFQSLLNYLGKTGQVNILLSTQI